MLVMKNALAPTSKGVRTEIRTASTSTYLEPKLSGNQSTGTRPMARAMAPVATQPKRLRDSIGSLPAVSRLVYRAGAVVVR